MHENIRDSDFFIKKINGFMKAPKSYPACNKRVRPRPDPLTQTVRLVNPSL